MPASRVAFCAGSSPATDPRRRWTRRACPPPHHAADNAPVSSCGIPRPPAVTSPAPLPRLHFWECPCHPVPDAGRAPATPLDLHSEDFPKAGRAPDRLAPAKDKNKDGRRGSRAQGPGPNGRCTPPARAAGSGRPRLSPTVAGAARLRHQSPDSPQVRAVGRGPCATPQRQSPSPRLTCASQAPATQPGPVAGPPWALPALDFLGRRGGPAALSLS